MDIISKVTNQGTFKCWKNNVYLFSLPLPSHREKYEKVSIELFYQDQDIQTKDKQGKWLHFSNEINIENDITTGQTTIRSLESPKFEVEFKKCIYSKDVDKIIDNNGNKVGISKSVFADYISNNEPGFENFDITEFEKIFTIIDDIVNQI